MTFYKERYEDFIFLGIDNRKCLKTDKAIIGIIVESQNSSYVVGSPVYEDDDIEYVSIEYDIKESPLYGTFLFDEFLDKNGLLVEDKEEKTIPITYGLIKATCGWSEFCDVTGGNHYAPNEWSIEDNEIFHVKESHAKELRFI